MQRGAAGDQHLEAGRRGQQLGHQRRGVEHLFEVVEQQQGALVAQIVVQDFQQWLAAGLAHTQRLRNRGIDERRIADRRQRHEAYPILEIVKQLGGDLRANAKSRRVEAMNTWLL